MRIILNLIVLFFIFGGLTYLSIFFFSYIKDGLVEVIKKRIDKPSSKKIKNYTNKINIKDKRKYKDMPIIKGSDRLISFNNEKLAPLLNDSYKLTNTFDNKERYYSLHYLLSHPELEFNMEKEINVYRTKLFDSKNDELDDLMYVLSDTQDYMNYWSYSDKEEVFPYFIERNILNTDFVMDLKEVATNYAECSEEITKYTKNINTKKLYDSFNELKNLDINKLPKIEKDKITIMTEDRNGVIYASFLGIKVMMTVVKKGNNYKLIIIDEFKKAFLKDLTTLKSIFPNEMELKYVINPKIRIHKEYDDFYLLNNDYIQNENIELDDKVTLYKKDLNNLNKNYTDLHFTLVKKEIKVIKINMKDLLNYIYTSHEGEEGYNYGTELLENHKVERNKDITHWSNMIETNYLLDFKAKKKFIKNLNESILEKEKLKYIEEYKEYMK